jgi:F-type H+-transporting ATPase subunit alpha
VEILKQPQYQPMDVASQVLVIWAATGGHLDDVPVEDVRRFETELLRFVENSHPGLLQNIREKQSLTDDIKADLAQALTDFKDRWGEETIVARQSASAAPSQATTAAGAPAAETVAAGV